MFRMFLASVLYLALCVGANAQDVSGLLTGEMRGLVLHDAPQPASDLPFLRVRPGRTEGSPGGLRGAPHRPEFLGGTWCAPCRLRKLPVASDYLL